MEKNNMLEEQDLKQIGKLLKENNKTLKDEIVTEIVTEVTGAVSDAFSEFEGKINKRVDGLEGKIIELDKKVVEMDRKIELRPTLNQIMSWGDKKIVSLELDMDKMKYIHQDELDKLPPQEEISRVLVERGYKVKEVKS